MESGFDILFADNGTYHPLDQFAYVTARNTGERAVRKSCDRCHGQKLRCWGSSKELSPSFTLPCSRCQRAGARCVFSARSSRSLHNAASTSSSASSVSTSVLATEGSISGNDFSPTSSIQSNDLLSQEFDFSQSVSDHPSMWADFGGLDMTVFNEPLANLDVAESDAPAPLPASPHQQFERAESLLEISRALETILIQMHTHFVERSVVDYAFSDVFGIFKRLDSVLRNSCHPDTYRREDSPTEYHLQNKDTFLTAHSYLLCVNIVAVLAENMLMYVCSQVAPRTSVHRQGVGYLKNESQVTSRLMRHHLGFGDMYSYLDPFGHALSCSCAVLDTSVEFILRIEAIIGVSREQGIVGEALESDRKSPNAGDSTGSLASRFVALMWEEEARNFGDSKTILARFLRCREEFSRLVKQSSRQISVQDPLL